MDSWDEIRTAYHVARAGTVSGAADVLKVHHATVIRHIDALEQHLGVKLFQRHARGYTPTDAGQDLLRIARVTDDQFSQLAGRLRGGSHDMAGELVVTSLGAFSHLLVPVLRDFRTLYPELQIRYLADDRLFRLEYGEAHVAIRAGAAPEQPDNVVQPFIRDAMTLYASKAYIKEYGLPKTPADFSAHYFVSANTRAPFVRWMEENIPQDRIGLRTNDVFVLRNAITMGAGIGFLSRFWATGRPELVQIMPSQEDWMVQLWLVTHMDLHRIAKVQAFLAFLKERAATWG